MFFLRSEQAFKTDLSILACQEFVLENRITIIYLKEVLTWNYLVNIQSEYNIAENQQETREQLVK